MTETDCNRLQTDGRELSNTEQRATRGTAEVGFFFGIRVVSKGLWPPRCSKGKSIGTSLTLWNSSRKKSKCLADTFRKRR